LIIKSYDLGSLLKISKIFECIPQIMRSDEGHSPY
jgi:hypothetical protein